MQGLNKIISILVQTYFGMSRRPKISLVRNDPKEIAFILGLTFTPPCMHDK